MRKIISKITFPIKAKIQIPGSKSLTNRALLLASLARGISNLSGVLLSQDTQAFISALEALGVKLKYDKLNSSCIVLGSEGEFPVKEAQIDCDSAGTVARFLLAACAATSGTYSFVGTNQLYRRPMKGLLEVLRKQGVIIDATNNDHLPLKLVGASKLAGGDVVIDASASGQFVSAMLMAAPLARSSMTITARNPVNTPFIEMTTRLMGVFGVNVRNLQGGRFSIPVPQQYVACDYNIEPDLTTAACFFAAAAVTSGEIMIQAFSVDDSTQGDVKFLELLAKMGCEIIPHVAGLTVRGGKELTGISVNMRDCSDTFMALAVVAPFAKTRTTITNIGHTRKQESDRINAMCSGFANIGIKTEQGEDWLRIYPGKPHFGAIDSCGDHRVAMAFAVIGLISGIEIIGAECVAKTCPNFFSLWHDLTK